MCSQKLLCLRTDYLPTFCLQDALGVGNSWLQIVWADEFLEFLGSASYSFGKPKYFQTWSHFLNFLKENIMKRELAKFIVALNLQKTYCGKLLASWISLAMQIQSVNNGLCRTIICITCYLDFGSFKCLTHDLYGIHISSEQFLQSTKISQRFSLKKWYDIVRTV